MSIVFTLILRQEFFLFLHHSCCYPKTIPLFDTPRTLPSTASSPLAIKLPAEVPLIVNAVLSPKVTAFETVFPNNLVISVRMTFVIREEEFNNPRKATPDLTDLPNVKIPITT